MGAAALDPSAGAALTTASPNVALKAARAPTPRPPRSSPRRVGLGPRGDRRANSAQQSGEEDGEADGEAGVAVMGAPRAGEVIA
ncbi:hypothetical protein GCM10027215_30950 [Nocardioides zeae]